MSDDKSVYKCNVCGWEYNPAEGDDMGGVEPGTAFSDVPDDWECPVCGADKSQFEETGEVLPDDAANQAPVLNKDKGGVTIVGSGLAGYSLARELRKHDAHKQITVITRDGGEVYIKPQLSNALGKGQKPADLVQKTAKELAKELHITIHTGMTIKSIDRDKKTIATDTNGTMAYDKLVLAVGADPRVFPAKGADAIDIATVNDINDYRNWRQKIGTKSRILLIGAGLIGSEFANDLASSGYEVAVVDPAPWPIARFLPEQAGKALQQAIAKLGANFYFGHTVAAYEKGQDAQAAVLDDGTRIVFDHVLSAVGLAPRISLAKNAGLETAQGIMVDDKLATSDSNIFAMGDCAQTAAGVLPFIAPLLEQAKCLASTLCGQPQKLVLPAMPVVVKTPALATVVNPPRPGDEGSWQMQGNGQNICAIFVNPKGEKRGFALTGDQTAQQNTLAKDMPALIGQPDKNQQRETKTQPKTDNNAADNKVYECLICSYSYVPLEGDPVGNIDPGTSFADLPDDWICPVCGAVKDEFEPVE